jgi:hypothetical protein
MTYKKRENSEEISCFEVLDVLFEGWRLLKENEVLRGGLRFDILKF